MNLYTSRRLPWIVLALSAVLSSGAKIDAASPLRETAERMVAQSGRSGGVCAIVGRPNPDLAMAIAEQGAFVVHCLVSDEAACEEIRKAIRSEGEYGPVSAGTFAGGRLAYVDSLINIVVVDGYPSLVDKVDVAGEVLRVLAPLGTAYFGDFGSSADATVQKDKLKKALEPFGIEDIGVVEAGGVWLRVRKPWPADIDEWTHYLHGADGNPVAQDRVVAPPKHFQWTSGPMWQRSHETDSSISTLVTARGRLFYIEDRAPISLAGQHDLPDKWVLVAQDAFNGVLLWDVPIEHWGWREWKETWFNLRPGDIPLNLQKRLVAVDDKVYVTLGYRAPVSELDAKTGKTLKTYEGTERTGEILYHDGTLVLSVLVGDRVRIMAVDASTGQRKWVSEKGYEGTVVDYYRFRAMNGKVKPADLDPTLNTATDGKVVAFISGPDVGCVDFRTGKEKWRSSFPSVKADHHAGGIQSKGNLWVGTMIVADGVVLHASPNKLAAFAADTGKLVWEQPKKYIGHLWYEWKDVFVIDGLVWTWSEELERGTFDIGRKRKQRTLHPKTVNGYDLKTGELKRKVSLGNIFRAHHHHRCYRNKATLRYILASRRGTEYVDLEHGKHTVHNWVRGTCHMGMMPANGLQYAPPHPCQCYVDEKLNGMCVLAPARPSDDRDTTGEASPRLVRGSTFGQAKGPEAGKEDWPTFRCDAARTGSAGTTVPDGADVLWRKDPGKRISAPTVVGDRLYAALVDEHHVVCLDGRDGTMRWEFAAGGRIDSPPTYYEGKVVFGSADGWVYCLRASDGELVWRFRAAPEERLMGAFGQLESAWPVHGSVLIDDGTLYFTVGRSSMLDGGMDLYALDPATGKVLHKRRFAGPHYNVENVEENFRLPMGTLPDVLVSDGSRIYMRDEAFDQDLKPVKGKPTIVANAGYLGDSYFKRMPWRIRQAKDWGRLLVHDNRSVYYVRMFDSLRGLDPTVYFTPGAKGYLLFAKNMQGGKRPWMERVPVRIRAMAVAGDRLFVAGPPDVVDPDDPLGAFEGRKGGVLVVVDTSTGKKLAEHKLPSPPVFNGIAAAQGRLYLTDEAGGVTCFGKQTALSAAGR